MPYLTVKLMEGRSAETKQKLVREITAAVQKTLQIDPIHIRIELVELKEGTFAVAGEMATVTQPKNLSQEE